MSGRGPRAHRGPMVTFFAVLSILAVVVLVVGLAVTLAEP